MKFHPILFSTPMVQAILEGIKTMTRRIVKPRTPEDFALMINMEAGINVQKQIDELIRTSCPYGKRGDILWVRETFYKSMAPDGVGYPAYYFKVSHDGKRISDDPEIKWKPSIHMPKEACRLFLKITNIRVERLKDIREPDGVAEGVRFTDFGKDKYGQQERGFHVFDVKHHDQCLASARSAFGNLWEKINGRESWDANPWVWVVSFERIEKPENFII